MVQRSRAFALGGTLTRKCAVVTGGAKGIGRAVCEVLAREGARVAVLSRNIDAAKIAAAELPQAAQGEHLGLSCDVTSEESRAAMIRALDEHKFSPTILVNNAGATKDGLLLRMSETDLADALNVNLVGSILVTKVLVKAMVRSREGSIVNIGSVRASQHCRHDFSRVVPTQ